MKFTSVLLALSAVVAMVQAVPFSDTTICKHDVGDVQGATTVHGLISVGNIPINLDLRKRFVDSILERATGGVPISGISKRDLAQSVSTDINIIQNAIYDLAAPIEATLTPMIREAFIAITRIDANADIQVVVKDFIGVGITENLTVEYIGYTVKTLVNSAVRGEIVDIYSAAAQAADLVHSLAGEVVLYLQLTDLDPVCKSIKALGFEIDDACYRFHLRFDIQEVVRKILGRDINDLEEEFIQKLVE
ncbi:MAG: hypothetical protein J3Q66DRAFT_396776 [Benniella sp.]|nr:MAG: hypothetical protein J3Q66DRAFT_396776 [Benniella sp.]